MSLPCSARLPEKLALDSWVQSSKCFHLAAAVSDKLLGEGIRKAALLFLTEQPPKRLSVFELSKIGLRAWPCLSDFAKGQFPHHTDQTEATDGSGALGFQVPGPDRGLSRGQT